MRKSLIAVASLALCLGFVACEDADDDADMGIMSGATSENSECCAAKAACEDKAAVEEASPGIVGEKANCSEKASQCPFSGKN